MKAQPAGWPVHAAAAHDSADGERRRHHMRLRFEAIAHSHRHRIRLRRAAPWLKALLLTALAVIALDAFLAATFPWPLALTLRHLAAAPDCTTARLAGLAPARRGEPGYWMWNDADGKGVACGR